MPDYLFHRLDGRGAPAAHRLLGFESDAEAMRRAIGPDFPHGCELWEGYRLVGRFCGPSRQSQVTG